MWICNNCGETVSDENDTHYPCPRCGEKDWSLC